MPRNNQSKNETFIDINQNIKNNPQGNNEANENAVFKDQNNIQNNNVAHNKTKNNGKICMQSTEFEKSIHPHAIWSLNYNIRHEEGIDLQSQYKIVLKYI